MGMNDTVTSATTNRLKTVYITTTLPYVNASPHIGTALEFVQADFLARTYRALGHEVFFSTGTDEHGQKIEQAAMKDNQTPKQYVDRFATIFKEVLVELNISNDAFIRTTDPIHKQAAITMWNRCNESGDIYKKSFTGLYCVGCEMFLIERDLVDGNCPDHQKPPQEITTENYFFKFSRYEQPLLDYLSSDSQVIIPYHRLEWAKNFVREGLQDFSISRYKDQLTWGVPVPGDDDHVMYVWFDALTNYISTLGWGTSDDESELYNEFWQEGQTIQVAGKDQIRMQSLMWQAMLMSAGEQPTDQIFYHGFINSGGQKMSKSLGNIIDPKELINEYGTDAVRYYLLRHIHPFDDSDMTHDKFAEIYKAHLVNGLGNLVSRILQMVESYGVEYETLPVEDILIDPEYDQYFQDIKDYKFNEALDWMWSEFNALDEYIAVEEPFKTIKTNETKATSDVAYCAIRLHELCVLLQPVMPETVEKIINAIESRTKPGNLFPRK